MLRRVYITLSLILALAATTMAQSPRVVLKSVVEGDRAKAMERLDKIGFKTRNEMPELCILSEVAVMCMEGQSLDNMMRGYEMLSMHIEAIRQSENLDKAFKGDEMLLDEVLTMIENNTLAAVKADNREETYRSYLELAKRGGHPQLSEVEALVERAAYDNAMRKRSVEACDLFISEFPASQYAENITKQRADLLYDKAMKSNDEQEMQELIDALADYPNVGNVENRLMETRYKRITRSGDIDQMRWFVELYPNHRDISRLKQAMADIEYPTLEDSLEALEAFVAYYPKVSQATEAKSRISILQIVERADIAEIFRYIKQRGYDRNYPRLQRAIVEKHGYLILTDDIRKVLLVRFINEEGKVGYLNNEGRVIVEPKYELRSYVGISLPSDKGGEEFECLTSRGLAVVAKDGKFGVINGKGVEVIPTNYADVAFLDSVVACVINRENGTGNEWQKVTYTCTTYDYTGKRLEDEHIYVTGAGVAANNNWDTTWFSTNVSIKDTYDEWEKSIYVNGKYVGVAYGGFHTLTPNYRWYQTQGDEKVNVIARNGSVFSLNFRYYDIEIIYGNVIMAESISSGNRCVIDLDKQSIISQGKFRNMYPMADEEIILVQYNDNYYGFVGRNLSPLFNERYDRAYSFNCGTAAVIKGGIGYLINVNGKQVSKSYDDIAPLAGHRGLYKVAKDGKCGIIDANDGIVIAIEQQPLRQGHYGGDSIVSVQSIAGVIEWADGVKTPIFSKKNE